MTKRLELMMIMYIDIPRFRGYTPGLLPLFLFGPGRGQTHITNNKFTSSRSQYLTLSTRSGWNFIGRDIPNG